MSLAPHVLASAPLAGGAPGDVVEVPAATLHHLRRVLRLADGAPLTVTDGGGAVADAELQGERIVLLAAVREVPAPSPRLVLAQALSKGRRAEDAVRVACELGVERIVPVVAERTQGRPDARAAAALVERWGSVAASALEQSRGVRLALVTGPVVGVTAAASPEPAALHLIAVPGAEDLPAVLASLLGATGDPSAPALSAPEVVVAVGPEGGWSPAEVEGAVGAGWRAVGLGPTVLRTEHAGPIAVAVAGALLGRWSRHPSAGASGATLADR